MARILIVEDNAANMKLATLLLLNAGHVPLCAVDAETFVRPDDSPEQKKLRVRIKSHLSSRARVSMK